MLYYVKSSKCGIEKLKKKKYGKQMERITGQTVAVMVVLCMIKNKNCKAMLSLF